MSQKLDDLDLRVAGALQVDGRASWRAIAAVLGEPERTVARRGTRLLESGLVAVTGIAPRGDAVLIGLRCAPGMARVAAGTLARRADSIFSYVLTGSVDCVAEVICPPDALPGLVLEDLPGTPGLLESQTLPVLRYFRTVHEWRPGLLTDAEVAGLEEFAPVTPSPAQAGAERFGREERAILRALAEDGRRTHEELARLAGVSEPTARRRVESLRREGHLMVRAVLEPAVIGLPVEAMLWISVPPRRVQEVGEALLESPYVRYAAAVMGSHQLIADVTVPDKATLYRMLTESPWVRSVDRVETTLLLGALKRSGVPAR